MLDSWVCANISVSSVEVQGGLSCSKTALFFNHHPSLSCVNKPLVGLQMRLQLAHQTNAFSTIETHLIKQMQIYVFCILRWKRKQLRACRRSSICVCLSSKFSLFWYFQCLLWKFLPYFPKY